MEILHMTFDYLKPLDLLRAFSAINSHIDSILHAYSRIRLNCNMMNKSNFYRICENIYPEQIQSLILTDDRYSPGQIKLFMTLLPLIQCINLESLGIIRIDDINLFCLILSHLENHPRIQSLTISDYYMNIGKKKSRYVSEILTSLSSLKYFTIMESSTLTTFKQPLLKLVHLTINSCNLNDLKIIFSYVPNLVYLKILLPFNDSACIFNYIPLSLRSLIIKSQRWILFNEIENILSLTKSLKRFILETYGEVPLLDANRWEILIQTKLPYLTEFALNITPEMNTMSGDEALVPFQSSFWIKEKHWYMACLILSVDQSCARLFSVPHFSPTDAWYSPNDHFINYSLSSYSFDDNCTKLRLCDVSSQVQISSPFKNIRTLSVECTFDNIDQLAQIINLLNVNHLLLKSYIENIPFFDILQAARNIRQLTICLKTSIHLIDWLVKDQNRYEQIKELYIEDAICRNGIDQIYEKFPKLEHISWYVKDSNDILYRLKDFSQLTSVIIRWNQPFKISSTKMDEYLQEINLCTDGTYSWSLYTLCMWID